MNSPELQEQAYFPIKCLDCDSPAMLNRVPSGKSNKWIHRHCWPCARRFYVGTDAQLAVAALNGVNL